MKRLVFPALLILAVILSGCPYESVAPLCSYDGSLKMDKHLLGHWYTFNGDGSYERLVFEKGDKNVYFVRHYSFDPDGNRTENYQYRAFTCDIGGTVYMNIEMKNSKYMIYKVKKVSDEQYECWAISDEYAEEHLENYGNAKTDVIRKYLDQNHEEAGFFDEKQFFYKEGSAGYEQHMKK